LKSGSLNLLEPSGPVEACHGIALTPLYGEFTEGAKLCSAILLFASIEKQCSKRHAAC